MTGIARKLHRGFMHFYDTEPLPERCVLCGVFGRVVKNGSDTRSVSLLFGKLVVYVASFLCRRVKCMACKRSWRQRPPGIVPHRHYQLCVTAEGMSALLFGGASQEEVTATCDCSRWTVARWAEWVGGIASPADLQARVAELAGAPIVAPVREAAARAGGMACHALRRAARVLSLLEGLAQAANLDPPGLRSVVRRVVDDRANHTTYASPSIPEFAHIGLQGRLGIIPM